MSTISAHMTGSISYNVLKCRETAQHFPFNYISREQSPLRVPTTTREPGVLHRPQQPRTLLLVWIWTQSNLSNIWTDFSGDLKNIKFYLCKHLSIKVKNGIIVNAPSCYLYPPWDSQLTLMGRNWARLKSTVVVAYPGGQDKRHVYSVTPRNKLLDR